MLSLLAEARKVDWPDVVLAGILCLAILGFFYILLKSDV